eukprot:1579978-Amphidinium_carterae.1
MLVCMRNFAQGSKQDRLSCQDMTLLFWRLGGCSSISKQLQGGQLRKESPHHPAIPKFSTKYFCTELK